jgi:uncharacterized protein
MTMSLPIGSAVMLRRVLDSLTRDGQLVDLRVGTHWTVAVADLANGLSAGLASTQSSNAAEHGTHAVREAGLLLGRSTRELAEWIYADRETERSIGFAAMNALVEVNLSACVERNAEEIILERGRGRRVAIVGHFPFVEHVRAAAAECAVLELNPGPGDLPAARAADVLPAADVVAITGMALVNGTFAGLMAACRRDAYVLLLGATVPLSPVFFDAGVSAVSGTLLTDLPAALAAVSQAATFRQIPGRRLLTLLRDEP